MKQWPTVKLGNILKESKIESKKPDIQKRIRVKLNVGGVEKRPDTTDKEGATRYYVRKAGQFIYGKQNLHKGAFGIVPLELDGYESSSDIPAFDVDESCFPEWIYYFFKQNKFYLSLEPLAKGVGSKRIQPKEIFEIRIPLPKREEQERILFAIQTFEQNYSKVLSEFTYQTDLILRLRALAYQNALSGKLTEKWRSAQKGISSVESLVRAIDEEKDKLAREKKNFKAIHLSKIKNGQVPFEIPNSWKWIFLGELIKEKPKNGYSPQGVNYVTEIKSLKLGATTKGFFDSGEYKYLDLQIPADSYLWLEPGDVLIQRSNSIDYVGISVVYTGGYKEFIYPDLMMKIQFLDILESSYLMYVLSSDYLRSYFRANASGTSGSMPKINQTIVLNALICLPPVEEQKEIAIILDRIFDKCTKIEDLVASSKNDLMLIYDRSLKNVFGGSDSEIRIEYNEIEEILEVDKVMHESINYSYKNNHSDMELEQLLEQNGKMSAISLWKMSRFENDIDAFYEEIKRLVEESKTVRESKEKGFLELAK